MKLHLYESEEKTDARTSTFGSTDINYERRDLEPITDANVPQYRRAETNRDGPRVSQSHSRAVTESDHINKQLTDRKQNAGTKIPQQEEEAGKH